MKETKKTKNRYIHGIDGIRSLAVIGVIFYHLLPSHMRGGYLGVTVFFAISGYLITDHFRQERQQNGKIAIGNFYKRRLSRIYPSLLGVLLTSAAYITLFQRNLLNNLRGIVGSSLLYINNWWQIRHGFSYFDRFSNESPFTHLWFLAVEGQNYLIWPIVFVLLVKIVKKKDGIFYLLLGASIGSALAMAIGYTPGADPTRVYYGTDTRLFSILLGAMLAFIWPTNRLKEQIPVSAKKVLNTVGILSLLLLISAFFLLDDHYTFVYYGGMYLVSFVSVLLLAVTVHPGASLDRWLTNPVFSYIGKRSYGIYLYQFPVMIFYEAKVPKIAEHLWLHTLIELILILLFSELSYQLIEKPFQHFTWKQLKLKIRKFFKTPLLKASKVKPVVGLLVFIVATIGIISAPTNAIGAQQEKFQEEVAANKKVAEQTKKVQNSQENAEDTQSSDTETTTNSTTETGEVVETFSNNPKDIQEKYNLSEKQVEIGQQMEITAFGDSVLLGSTRNIQEIFPKAVVDADVGRQLYNSTDLLKELKEDDLLKDKVILALGTNGTANEAQFDELMQVIGDRQVYLVNVYVPTQRWQNDVNSLLDKMATKYENVELIDWYEKCKDHEDWFREDQVHPTSTGRIAYTKLLADHILK
ncbi:MAG TPA: acetyltransferase [Candidatus Tetragenococcus pullicola]|nr:acetyltransferase [Candidatus Tetragenococcus pullicola]